MALPLKGEFDYQTIVKYTLCLTAITRILVCIILVRDCLSSGIGLPFC